MIKTGLLLVLLCCCHYASRAQEDSLPVRPKDTLEAPLRIINFNANFSQHIDSTNVYQFRINKPPDGYFWTLKDAPVGLSINKDNGLLQFKAARNYFQAGKLRYDFPYQVQLGVQSLDNSLDRVDSSFSISFYNTEIIPSLVKLSVAGPVTLEEGETLSFRVQCENGSFPIEHILFSSTVPVPDCSPVSRCDETFRWVPDYEFTREGEREVLLYFIGSTRFQQKDTASIRVRVRNALNYPQAKTEFDLVNKNIRTYVLQLKWVFLQLDKKLKKVKKFRTGFDLTSASTALTGTILNSSASASSQRTGKILPSIGVAMVPIKEATAPNKTVEQNQAGQIRASIKRLEYMLTDNVLVGNKDPQILDKITRLKSELKQVQVQLIDIPVELSSGMTEEELNNYFNSPKVNKKYRLKRQ